MSREANKTSLFNREFVSSVSVKILLKIINLKFHNHMLRH